MTTTDTAAVPTDLDATIDRYFATWNETDADRRRALCRQIWAADGHYSDPLLDATGPDAISDGLGSLQTHLPGHTVARSTEIDAHHDRARFGWTVTAPDGTIAVTGIDVVVFAPDGALHSISGFFGQVATLPDAA
jgi:hypothetical protein